MKYTRNEFLIAESASIPVDLVIENLDEQHFAESPIRALPYCHVSGWLHFDGKSRVVSELALEGTMIVPDSITDEDVEVDFDTSSNTEYSFEPVGEDEEEVVVLPLETLDLLDEIVQAVVFEAPMSITRLARDEYPSGNGWTLISDQDETPEEEKEIDPRWAKLKDIQFED